jgi:tetratricopeptide (TPR) repeat protein
VIAEHRRIVVLDHEQVLVVLERRHVLEIVPVIFNAQRYSQALTPLSRALDADPDNAILRRMLAMTCFNTEAYDKAAALLATDRGRDADPSLQYAYGLALVRSDRAAEAEAIFSRLLAEHGSTPEVSVVLGHAYAQQGNYDAATDALHRALRLNPRVADANSALGMLYLKQGKLAEAEGALRAELDAHPGDVKARQTLATVLLDGSPEVLRNELSDHGNWLLVKLTGKGWNTERHAGCISVSAQRPRSTRSRCGGPTVRSQPCSTSRRTRSSPSSNRGDR